MSITESVGFEPSNREGRLPFGHGGVVENLLQSPLDVVVTCQVRPLAEKLRITMFSVHFESCYLC